MRSIKSIYETFEERKRLTAPLIERMREIRDAVDGEIVVPLPEMDRAEKPAVANLVAEAIDQVGLRTSSTLPNLWVPPANPRAPRSREYSDIARLAVLSWWEENRIRRILRRRARFLVAYGAAPVMLRPNFKTGMPEWRVLDPLATYPNITDYYDDDAPLDCIYAYRKSFAWLEANYPEQAARLWKGTDCKPQTLFDVIEYNDEHETVLAVCGSKESRERVTQTEHNYGFSQHDYSGWQRMTAGREQVVELERVKNRAGICTVVAPKRITLSKLQGQYNQILGLYQQQAKLVALDLIAVEKAIFPDMALIGTGANAPQLLDDEWKDGRTGEVNVIYNGDVKLLNANPGQRTSEAQDRLERGMRMAGIPSQFSGENPTGIRTGRAGEIAMSAQVDFRIQEYQEQIADSLVQENMRAMKIAQAYFGNRPKSYFVSLKNGHKAVEYIPNKHFEHCYTKVVYPMPGADVNNAVIGIGARLGQGTLSTKQAMWLDPLVEDPEAMYDEIVAERLERAMLDGLAQMAAQGNIPPGDIARICRLVVDDNLPLAEAVERAQREAQERQAAEVPATDPAAQPGIALPGTGAEAGMAIPEPSPSSQNLANLLYTLRQPAGPPGGAPEAMTLGAGA